MESKGNHYRKIENLIAYPECSKGARCKVCHGKAERHDERRDRFRRCARRLFRRACKTEANSIVNRLTDL